MDERQFSSEYQQVCDQLYTFLLRTVGNADSAADILQDAVYRAFRSRHQFRGDSSFKTWIYRIAINTMKNQWARARRERQWFDEIRDVESVNSPSPEKLVADREDASGLSRALILLEKGYRVPFMLKHVDGMSYREIAEVLGIEENTARVRVYRARHTLRTLLREDSS